MEFEDEYYENDISDQRLEAENLHVITLAQSWGQKFSNSGGIPPNKGAREATENPETVLAAVTAAGCPAEPDGQRYFTLGYSIHFSKGS